MCKEFMQSQFTNSHSSKHTGFQKKRFNNYEEAKHKTSYQASYPGKKSYDILPKPSLEISINSEQKMSSNALHLYSKVANNDTLTVKKSGDPILYYQIVSCHFSNPANNEIRLESLGSAVNNMFLIVNLLEISGVSTKVKVK
jgi:hypothetical protein